MLLTPSLGDLQDGAWKKGARRSHALHNPKARDRTKMETDTVEGGTCTRTPSLWRVTGEADRRLFPQNLEVG